MVEFIIYIVKGIFQILMWTWWLLVPLVLLAAYQNFRKSKWINTHESVILSVKVPKNNEKGPVAAEMLFAALHGILKSKKELTGEGSIQEHVSFEIVSGANSITFYVWTPKHLQDFVEGQIYAQYPTAEIVEISDYAKNIDIDSDGKDDYFACCELKLKRPEYYPIKTFLNFEVDPLAGITGALSKLESGSEKVWIQILTRPVSDRWKEKGLAYVESLKGGTSSEGGIRQAIFNFPSEVGGAIFDTLLFPADNTGKSKDSEKKLSHNVEIGLTGVEEKANKLGFEVKIRVLYVAKNKELAKERLRMAVGAFKQFNTTNLNGFTATKTRTGREVLEEYRARLFADAGFVLNIEEIASLYHFPHVSVATPNIVWTSSKKGEPPANLPYVDNTSKAEELTVFGETTFRGKPRPFGIKRDDRRRHMYIIGKSGVGKSKMIELLAMSDIKNGEGVGIVDPHGELVQNVLKYVPKERKKDVIYFNPADKNFPIAFNPLETTPELREETASGFISVFKRLFGYSWGPRLEYVLRYTVLALTYSPDATMLGVVRMLTDKEYRKEVVSRVEDPVVKSFWLKEFTTYNDRFATEAVAPILNKVGQFTASPIIRNIVGQVKSTVDFKDAMNNQKIVLIDLSTGKIGEDNSALLGSMIITRMQLAAMSRSKQSENERRDFYLYVDEFQNFATESFATILSEARKYKLNLTLANQYITQMEETVRDAVFGNVGSLITFRVGATDAAFLEKEFTPVFDQADLINLDNRHIYVRMLIDGVTSIPFSAATLFVQAPEEDFSTEIIDWSREHYGTPREKVEADIAAWSSVDNIDVEKKIMNQPTTALEMSNEDLERGVIPESKLKHQAENKRKHDKEKAKQRTGKPTTSNNRNSAPRRVTPPPIHTPKNQKMVPLKSHLREEQLEQLKKMIKKVTSPAYEKPEIKDDEKQKIDEKLSGHRTEIKNIIKKGRESLKVKEEKVKEGTQQPKPEPQKSEPQVKEVKKEIKEEKVSLGAIKQFPRFRLMTEEDVRKITKEEFKNLTEIKPNEKIIIVGGNDEKLKKEVSEGRSEK